MLITALLILIALLALSVSVAAVMGVLGMALNNFYSVMPLHRAMGEIIWNSSSEYILFAIPLFVMLGEILLRAGIAERAYNAVALWLSWLPGGLMHANIGTCAMFAATSGSSVATAATVGTVAIPEIKKRGYNEALFLGTIAAGGTLGILIPPSINFILYGLLTNNSVPRLYLAGFIPGFLLASFFMLIVLFACLMDRAKGGHAQANLINPGMTVPKILGAGLAAFAIVTPLMYLDVLSPSRIFYILALAVLPMAFLIKGKRVEAVIASLTLAVVAAFMKGWRPEPISDVIFGLIFGSLVAFYCFIYRREGVAAFLALLDLIPPFLIFLVVIGTIYAGWATPTEAASLGVVASLLLAAYERKLNWATLKAAGEGTMRTTGIIMLIILAAQFLNFVLAAVGATDGIGKAIESLGLGKYGTLMLIIVFYLILGCFMETISMMILTTPFIYPIVTKLGWDPIWWGIVLTILIEAALITPPVGLNLYVVQGMRERGPVGDVIRGSLPFVGAMMVLVFLLMAIPGLALWLPEYVMGK
ncbi:MAG: TRAP transporter large permease [Hyphomicrobiaceae bacterium]